MIGFLCYVEEKGIIVYLNKLRLSTIIFKSLIINKYETKQKIEITCDYTYKLWFIFIKKGFNSPNLFW